MTTGYEWWLICAGYRQGTGDLYSYWTKPKTTVWPLVLRLAPGAFIIIGGLARLLYISL